VDGFVLRLSPRGKLDYVQTFGGEEADGGKNIAIDDMGRLYLSGYFSEVADLDPGKGAAVRIARENGDELDLDDDDEGSRQTDLFLAQLGLRGELQWVRVIGGDDYEYLSKMRVVDDGEILLSGAFAGRMTCGSTGSLINPSSVVISLEGDDDFDDDGDRDSSYDAFVARYQSDGTFLEVKTYGGVGDDWANDAVFKTDRAAAEVGGIFSRSANFSGSGAAPTRDAVALDDLFALSTI
jgi:hypothetical protein